MHITGYGKSTEKEHDYSLIHQLLRKYQIPTTSIDEFLDTLKGDIFSSEVPPNQLVRFHFTRGCSQMCIIHFDTLPENTTRLVIEVE